MLNISEIATPLSDLTHKKQAKKIQWTAKCENAFNKLKTVLTTDPVLRAPDFQREFIIYTDASDFGLGAVLSQADDNGNHHLVTYLSKKLQAGERHLLMIERECLVIVWTLQKLRPYIWGQHFCTLHQSFFTSVAKNYSGDPLDYYPT